MVIQLKIDNTCVISQLNFCMHLQGNQLQTARGEETIEQVQYDKTLSICVWVQSVALDNLPQQCKEIDNNINHTTHSHI